MIILKWRAFGEIKYWELNVVNDTELFVSYKLNILYDDCLSDLQFFLVSKMGHNKCKFELFK